jgi:hypothetical protein
MVHRVFLVHWNDREADERVARLRGLGFDAWAPAKRSGLAIRALCDDPPDAVVVDLSRSPGEGRNVAVMIRGQAATRRVPIVFVDGEPERVERVRRELPDAVFADWEGIAASIEAAIKAPPANPVVPGPMDAYSGTPLPKKLGIGAGVGTVLLRAPEGFEATLGELPAGAVVARVDSPDAMPRVAHDARIVVLFARTVAELESLFPTAADHLAERGSLWIAWPKRTSARAGDLSEPAVRRFGLDRGFVDYKIASIDGTWSGLRFARRASVPVSAGS